MNENQQDTTASPDVDKWARRFIGWLLFGLVVSFIAGVVSVVTGITSISHHTTSSITTTTITHHTLASRIVLSFVTAFHAVLVVGIFRRTRIAWRAGFALPILWTLSFMFIAYPQFDASDQFAGVVVPFIIMTSIGAWRTFIWWRQWTVCEIYFK
jgi:hypothetical protein